MCASAQKATVSERPMTNSRLEQGVMCERWEFYGGTDDYAWHWRLVDVDTGSVVKQSKSGFQRLFDCAKDAGLEGYGGELPTPVSA